MALRLNKFLKDNFKDKNILLLGFGLEGKSTARILKECGFNFSIADANKEFIPDKEFSGSIDKLITGSSYLDSILDFDLIFKSPGVPLSTEIVAKNKEKFTSQSEIFLKLYKNQIIGVTGTKGKSTISSLIFHFLKEAGYPVLLGGNIGLPLFELEKDLTNESIIVSEFSCHQLQFVSESPHLAVLTNIFKEHLDYYSDFSAYKQTKFNIFEYQTCNDILVYPKSVLKDYDLKTKLERKPAKKMILTDNHILLDDKVSFEIEDFESVLYGEHNKLNQKLALTTVCLCTGKSPENFIPYLLTFKSLEHRLERFWEFGDYVFINDSISTIPETTIEAINAFNNDIDYIYIGGLNRSDNITYGELFKVILEKKIKNVFLLPDTGEKILNELIVLFPKKDLSEKEIIIEDGIETTNFIKIKTIEESLPYLPEKANLSVSDKKKIVLFSPAAPSYNSFKNFTERGSCFKNLIKEYYKDLEK